MTGASDNRDDDETVRPNGEGLWADVRVWADAILSVFGDLKALTHVGLTRSLAVKLCNWLWGVEGAIRRLIIAEALKLDPASLNEAKNKPGGSSGAVRERHTRRPSFRIFGFNRQDGAETASAAGPASRTGLPAYGHIPFPLDPLLSIGRRRKRKQTRSARRINPLDRQGRISRLDPDYGLEREEDAEALLLGLSSSRPARPARPRPAPVLAQERADYLAPRSDISDWRRVEEEWKRQIPAPHLAARVWAIVHVMEKRDAAIHRMARVFQRGRGRAAQILDQPLPKLLWPRRARAIYRCREVEDLVPRSHADLLRLDTS